MAWSCCLSVAWSSDGISVCWCSTNRPTSRSAPFICRVSYKLNSLLARPKLLKQAVAVLAQVPQLLLQALDSVAVDLADACFARPRYR
jgi:hypothetical protein